MEIIVKKNFSPRCMLIIFMDIYIIDTREYFIANGKIKGQVWKEKSVGRGLQDGKNSRKKIKKQKNKKKIWLVRMRVCGLACEIHGAVT